MNKMTNKVELRICIAIFMFLPAIAGLTQGATITVGSGGGYDFNTIQAGIDAAVSGDTVLVAPGEYVITEPITFRGKVITVKSEAGRDETTIRMGTPVNTNRGSVIVFENNETSESILDGFTITGGTGSWVSLASAYAGGGIYFDSSSGIIRNCAIVQNRADGGGGVLAYSGSSPTLIECAILENTATNGGGLVTSSGSSLTLIDCTVVENMAKNGGGVMVDSESSGTLTNCIIRDNSATGVTLGVDGYGGGLSCVIDSSLILTNCTIKGNSAVRAGGGGHFWQNSSAIMTHCNISENSAGESGGGLNCSENSSATMTNCIIRDNSAALGQGGISCWYGSITMSYCEIIGNKTQNEAGGVYVGYSSAILTNCLIALNTAHLQGGGGVMCSRPGTSLTISNCTIWGNSGGSQWGGGGVLCRNASASITNSIIWGNTAPKGSEISVEVPTSTLVIDYSNVAGGQAEVNVGGGCTLNWGVGNIDTDPLFTDPNNGDYHLKSQAGRWDPNGQSWVQDDVTSPCIDAGDPNSDWTEEIWPHGERINMGAFGGTLEASMSNKPESMSLPRVAYIYGPDAEATESFRSFLMSYGCPTTLIGVDDVATAALDSYDVIVVASDAGYSSTWQGTQFVAMIDGSGKPIIGLGQGGYDFFGVLELWIGRPNGGHGSRNSIEVIDPNCLLFSMPYSVDIPENRALQLYTETDHIGIYLWPAIPETVTVLGSLVNDYGYFPLVMEDNRYLFWGFTESPLKMTEEGKRLFINVVIRASNKAWGS
jgi:hypothetical protein